MLIEESSSAGGLTYALGVAAADAASATTLAMQKYGRGEVVDEDDITGVLIGALEATFRGKKGIIQWSSSILRHRRGVAAQEKKVGADFLIHVSLSSGSLNYSKGILVQAKRVPAGTAMSVANYKDLKTQCRKMRKVSDSAFVLNYRDSGITCGSASTVLSSDDSTLTTSCSTSAHRFFLDLFECRIGDQRIRSASFHDLPAVSLKGKV